MKKQGKRKIEFCGCENGSVFSTYIEKNLKEEVFQICCSSCDDCVDFNGSDDVVKDWNKKQKSKVKVN